MKIGKLPSILPYKSAALHLSNSATSSPAHKMHFDKRFILLQVLLPLLLLLLTTLFHGVTAAPQHRKLLNNASYCESWKFSVETNDAGNWSAVPRPCVQYVVNYMTGGRYLSDSKVVAADSLAFAKTVDIAADGMDAWVFDIDETLLSNLAFFLSQINGSGGFHIGKATVEAWKKMGEAPALPASLKLYKEVNELGFKIFLLTGRGEAYRNATVKNLLDVGYSNWERLILRGPSDQGTLAIDYKSKKRHELEDEGYRIQGSSGDQWSDLLGYAIARRSFKLPNPMYHAA
ncbi:hypothetical protein Ancab_028525 [Ancistrocladus abbreviatus]